MRNKFEELPSEQGPNYPQMAYELAKKNKCEEVDNILKNSINWNWEAFALCGYAEGNHQESLNNLLDKSLQLSVKDNVNPSLFFGLIILGYARIDNHKKVDLYLSRVRDLDQLACQLRAVEGYAEHNNCKLVESLYSLATTSENLLELKKCAISHFGMEILEKMYEEEQEPELLNFIKEDLIKRSLRKELFKKTVGYIAQEENAQKAVELRKYAIRRYIHFEEDKFSFDKLKFLVEKDSPTQEVDVFWDCAVLAFAYIGKNVQFVDLCLNEIKDEEKLLLSKHKVLFFHLTNRNAESVNDFTSKYKENIVSIKEKLVKKNWGQAIGNVISFGINIKLSNEGKDVKYVMEFSKCIDDKVTREYYIDLVSENLELQNIVALKQSAADFNQFMHKHNFNYSQAMAWKQPNWILVWFLQGIQIFKDDKHPYKISPEIFMLISSYLLDCDDKEAKESFDNHCKTIPETLYAVSTQTLCAKRFGTSFNLFPKPHLNCPMLTQEKYEAGMLQAKEKYLYRSGSM